MIVAGIDIGTLTCRLLIAEILSGGFLREIDSDRRILRLGEGVDQAHLLKTEAMNRVIEVLSEWQETITVHSVEATVVVATSAVREATNQQEFLNCVWQRTGLQIEVLSGEEEARRSLLGIDFGLSIRSDNILGLDIGGGSTELFRTVREGGAVAASLDWGVVRLTERYFQSDPPSEHEVNVAEHCIRRDIQKIQSMFGELTDMMLVGTAGTVTTLAAMAQELAMYEPSRIHNYSLSLEKIHELENVILACTAAERSRLPGLEAGREGVIVAGTIILRTIMETFGFEHCHVSDYGLREGIIVDLFKRNVV
ncbi:MAG: hypothetical protein ACPGYT_09880 [Nitrospirales bacterium]